MLPFASAGLRIKTLIKEIPLFGPAAEKIVGRAKALTFPGSANFWESVYRQGGTSGPGSYGHLARYKAEILNHFVRSNGVRRVIEFGCGDGAQLQLAEYPEYVGVDVSAAAV